MKSQITLSLFSLFVFSVQPLWAEDLSCPPEEPSKIGDLVTGINARLKAGTISKEFCNEKKACYSGSPVQTSDCLSENYNETFSGYQKYGNCNMDLQERQVLSEYMGTLYGCMNRALYSGKGSVYPTLNSSLNSALKRFPAYEGFVFRGSSLPKAVLEQHQVGKTITYPAYTSTSTDSEVAGRFGTHQFLIYSKSGRPIMGKHGGGYEREVLFAAGTRFRVLASTGTNFFLREVEGVETEAQAKAEDLRILNLAKKAKKNFISSDSESPDTWRCPLDDKKIPARLVQKTIPNVGKFIE